MEAVTYLTHEWCSTFHPSLSTACMSAPSSSNLNCCFPKNCTIYWNFEISFYYVYCIDMMPIQSYLLTWKYHFWNFCLKEKYFPIFLYIFLMWESCNLVAVWRSLFFIASISSLLSSFSNLRKTKVPKLSKFYTYLFNVGIEILKGVN